MEHTGAVTENQQIAVAEKREVDTSMHQELRSGNWFVPAAEFGTNAVTTSRSPTICSQSFILTLAWGDSSFSRRTRIVNSTFDAIRMPAIIQGHRVGTTNPRVLMKD